MNNLYQKIVEDLKAHEDKEGAAIAKTFHKYHGYESYGMITPDVRSILRQYKEEIQQLYCKDAFALAMKFYTAHIEEQALAGNYVLQQKIDCITPAKFDFLDKALDHFRSWSAVDDICVEGGKVLSVLLQKYPKEILSLLRKWNKSPNMWKRRASVVPFTRKNGESGIYTKEGLELCGNIVWSEEDLVRKAVGWALKDLMRGDKQKVLNYVKQMRKVGVPRIITSYAIRDLERKERNEILNIKEEE